MLLKDNPKSNIPTLNSPDESAANAPIGVENVAARTMPDIWGEKTAAAKSIQIRIDRLSVI